MNPRDSLPSPLLTDCDEIVTYDEVDGCAVVRIETTFVLSDPEAVADVLRWVEARRSLWSPSSLLDPVGFRPLA